MSVWLTAVQQGAAAGRTLLRGAAETRAGRLVSEIAAGARDAIVEDVDVDWHEAGRRAEERLGRVIAVIAPVVVQSLDPRRADKRIDVDKLLENVDVDALLRRVDVNALLAEIDVDALLDRADVTELAKRAKIGELVAKSASDVAGSALDLRRQARGLTATASAARRRASPGPAASLPARGPVGGPPLSPAPCRGPRPAWPGLRPLREHLQQARRVPHRWADHRLRVRPAPGLGPVRSRGVLRRRRRPPVRQRDPVLVGFGA